MPGLDAEPQAARRRATRWFWVMVVDAVAAMGALYRAIGADPSAGTAVQTLVSSVVLLATTAQAARIAVALGRKRGGP